jgi:hypothetical protein
MGSPYVPTSFATPIVATPLAGLGNFIPYISNTQYMRQPTSMGTDDLVVDDNAAAQAQELYNVIFRASEWADKIIFGADPDQDKVSLRASLVSEMASVRITNGFLRLVCDYKPVIEVRGVDVGLFPGQLSPIGTALAQATRIGRRTIYVPYQIATIGTSSRQFLDVLPADKLTVAWTYVVGYAHSQLATNAVHGNNTLVLAPTDGGTGLLGFYTVNASLQIIDGASTERVVIQSISGSTITTAQPLLYDHTVPQAPDFIPVTSVPKGVQLGVTFLTNMLLKTRGDNAIQLEEITEPRHIQKDSGGIWSDFKIAYEALKPYIVRVKAPR